MKWHRGLFTWFEARHRALCVYPLFCFSLFNDIFIRYRDGCLSSREPFTDGGTNHRRSKSRGDVRRRYRNTEAGHVSGRPGREFVVDECLDKQKLRWLWASTFFNEDVLSQEQKDSKFSKPNYPPWVFSNLTLDLQGRTRGICEDFRYLCVKFGTDDDIQTEFNLEFTFGPQNFDETRLVACTLLPECKGRYICVWTSNFIQPEVLSGLSCVLSKRHKLYDIM